MKTLDSLFKNNKPVEIPDGLFDRIFLHIDQESQRLARKYKILWGGLCILSIGGAVASGLFTVQQASSSNFGSYFSLIFSDGSALLSMWKQLLLSLVESLPFVEIIVFLVSITVVLWSIRNFLKNSGEFNNHAHATIA